MCLTFIILDEYENFLTTKISRITVYMYLHKQACSQTPHFEAQRLTCVLLVSYCPKCTWQTTTTILYTMVLNLDQNHGHLIMNCTKLVADKSNVLRLGSRCEGVNERLHPEVGSANGFLAFLF